MDTYLVKHQLMKHLVLSYKGSDQALHYQPATVAAALQTLGCETGSLESWFCVCLLVFEGIVQAPKATSQPVSKTPLPQGIPTHGAAHSQVPKDYGQTQSKIIQRSSFSHSLFISLEIFIMSSLSSFQGLSSFPPPHSSFLFFPYLIFPVKMILFSLTQFSIIRASSWCPNASLLLYLVFLFSSPHQ